MTAGVRQVFEQQKDVFDPRSYLKVGRQYVKDIVAHKIKDVLGSDGKAADLTVR
jgi:fructose-bisphosphate aldolase class II